jgi:N-acetylneuraminate synthase/N,N'-diacetyllegionaminate synthase
MNFRPVPLFGEGRPCFVIAEIGINHNGSLDLAKRSIDAARQAGVDAVKFQNYRVEDFLSDHTLTYKYVSQGRTVTESQWDMFKRCEMDDSFLSAAIQHCRDVGIAFGSTPTSEAGLAQLVDAGADFVKNGSDFLTHLPLIARMARSGLPTILSTGMATKEDVSDAVSAFVSGRGGALAVLHCVSVYPAPPNAMNLRRMHALALAYGCNVGLSDHSEGCAAASAATAMGAKVIEKHFTIDRNLPGPDHRFSADPNEMAALVRAVRDTEVMLGEALLDVGAIERGSRDGYRLSCTAGRDLPAGSILTPEDIRFRRPGTGLPPKSVDQLVGRRLIRACRAGDIISLADVS